VFLRSRSTRDLIGGERNHERVAITTGLPDYRAPLPLADFIAASDLLEHSPTCSEAYLYHGTNCFRRWEITRSGAILPGRSGYSFYCGNEDDAFNHARSACLRDIRGGAANSLIGEPVVLKVAFTPRTWIQVDFIQETQPGTAAGRRGLCAAVLGPVPLTNIVEVLHCSHGRRGSGDARSVRTFADQSFQSGIRRLRRKSDQWRLDAWLRGKLSTVLERAGRWLGIRRPPEITTYDVLYRLSQLETRLRLRS